MSEWKYYNNAMLPDCPPHVTANVHALDDNPLWKSKAALFARWTSNFDCGYETKWWYCIKDTAFSLGDVNAKKRYEINKGNKNFDVFVINPLDYVDDMYELSCEVWSKYCFKVNTSYNDFKSGFEHIKDTVVFGAFSKSTKKLCAYAYVMEYDSYLGYKVHKALPKHEKEAVNAAVVYAILKYYENDLMKGKYLCDGERNILHETAFQNYLEKYFGFRKAYCQLHIKYKFVFGLIVKTLYPFRKIIDKLSFLKKVSAVLRMHSFMK